MSSHRYDVVLVLIFGGHDAAFEIVEMARHSLRGQVEQTSAVQVTVGQPLGQPSACEKGALCNGQLGEVSSGCRFLLSQQYKAKLLD